jgi:class 3 adenylate cyclase
VVERWYRRLGPGYPPAAVAVLITEATRERLSGEPPPLEERPPLPLKGKTRPVAMFAATAERAAPVPPQT